MDVFIYNGALYCEVCGDKIIEELTSHGIPPGDDSESWPQGHPSGGGESDTPEHCDECRVFLENPLTSEGVGYVEEAVLDALVCAKQAAPLGRPLSDSVAWSVWREFYDIEVKLVVGDMEVDASTIINDFGLKE